VFQKKQMPKQRTLSAEDKRDLRNAKRLARPFNARHDNVVSSDESIRKQGVWQKNERKKTTVGLCGLEEPKVQTKLSFNEAQKRWNCDQNRKAKKAYAFQKKKENGIRKRLGLRKEVRSDAPARDFLLGKLTKKDFEKLSTLNKLVSV